MSHSPLLSNFIGTQISNGEADGFDTRVEEVEDGSFEQAVKDGKVDEEGYKIDREGKRTSKQPVFSRLTSTDFSMTALPTTKNLKQTSMKCSATIPIHRLPSILRITA